MRPTVLLDHELALSQSGYTVRALLRFRGRAPTESSRIPLNLALVLDRFGSMAGEPLAAAREAAAFLVRRLAPEDTVSVVAYDHEVETVAQPATGEAQSDLARRIEGIEPGGSTNLSGGWLRGRELAAPAVRRGTASPKAEAAARRTIQLDPEFAQPRATLAYVLTYYHLDWRGAEELFRHALAIDPGYSTAHQWYGNLLTVSGRFDEAEREMRRAREADPLSLIANAALGWTLYHAGRYEDALEQCRGTLTLDPDYQLAHLWGGWALEAMGRREEARAWIGRAVELSRGSLLTRLSLAHLLAGSESFAERDSALSIVRESEAAAARGAYVPSYEIGKVHLALGDRDRAIEWLRRATDERSHSRAFLRIDPQLAALRGDPRFVRLTAVLDREKGPLAGGPFEAAPRRD